MKLSPITLPLAVAAFAAIFMHVAQALVLQENIEVERLRQGFSFTEGAVYVEDGDYLLFSDVNDSKTYKWSQDGSIEIFRNNTNRGNGNALDNEGRLITCESGGRRVVRIEEDGSVTVLVDNYEGQKLNAPNDVVVQSNGVIWFTDPNFGLNSSAQELDGQYLFRFDPATDSLTIAADGFDKPNGLAFSPDESILYVANNALRKIRLFEVQPDGSLTGGDNFIDIPSPLVPDGMRVDAEGNLFIACFGRNGGIRIYNPDGEFIRQIDVPENTTNCSFGPGERVLYITAGRSIYRATLRSGEPPAPPSELKATLTGNSAVEFTWTDNSDNEDGFVLEQLSGDEWIAFETAPVDATQLSITLLADTVMKFRLRSQSNDGGLSEPSNTVVIQAGSAFFYNSTDNGSFWRQNEWLGSYNVESYPKIYHEAHQWWFIQPLDLTSFWAFDYQAGMEWLYSSADIYPFLYRAVDDSWLYYFTDTANPRWYYNYTTGAQESDG